MDFNQIVGFIVIALGPVQFLLSNLVLFRTKSSNMFIILEGIGACVPVFGAIMGLALLVGRGIVSTLPNNTKSSYAVFDICARDNRIARFLLNKLDWKEYDSRKENKI